MSIDVPTLSKLQQADVVEKLNESLSLCAGDLGQRLLVVPDGYQVQDLSVYQETARRMAGSFVTDNLDSFSKYAESFGLETAYCFIHASELTSKIVFDFYNQETGYVFHRKHMAILKARKTSFFKALEALCSGRDVSQRDMCFFLEENQNFAAYRDGTLLPSNAAAITAIRNIKVNQTSSSESKVGNLNQERSLMEKIDADTSGANRLPDTLIFGNVFPLEWIGPMEVSVRLAINTMPDKDNQYRLIPRIIAKEQLDDQIANAFKEKVQKELVASGMTNIVFGEFSA